MEAERKYSSGNLNKLNFWNISKTASVIFELLLNYLSNFKIVYRTVCKLLDAKTDWILLKVTARIVIDLNEMEQD